MATMNGKTRNPNVESRKKPESQMTKNFRGDSRKTSLVRLSGIRFLSIFRHSSFGFWNLSALDGPAWSAMLGGAMSPMFSAAGAEFLENYQRDVSSRWSSADLASQQEFVNTQIAGRHWLDWSTPAAALQLVQAAQAQTAVGAAGKYEAVVLAGPVVELLEPSALFPQAAAALVPGGKLIGVIPCLRDNSPESRGFTEIAAATLWPYYTAEELLEMLRETGGQLDSTASGFRAVPQFNEAVLEDRLGFKGFNRIFERLTAQGYDPMEVGWGELRLVALLN